MTSESKLACLIKSVKAALKNDGLQWNPKRCAVTLTRRGILFANSADVKVDGNAKIPNLEEGQEFKFLGVLDCLRQEENSCGALLKSIPVGCPLSCRVPSRTTSDKINLCGLSIGQ